MIKCDNCNFKKGRKKKNCQIHSFVMKNKISTVKYKQKVNINFCPLLNKTKNIYQDIIPSFNSDGKQHFPAFSLQVDQDYMKANEKNFIKEHQQKVSEYQFDIIQIYQPKPNRKNLYCAVCKDNYEDYRQHIRTQPHKNNIKTNKYNDLIISMCNQIERCNKRKSEYKLIDKISKYKIREIQVNTIATDESKIIF